MKLKYKKIILLTTMSTMGIGLLTLSVSHDKTKAEESLNQSTAQESTLLADESTSADANNEDSDTLTTIPSVSPTPTLIPSPTPLPVFEIEKDVNPKITNLFEDYYAAKSSCDIKKLKSLLSDSAKVETQKQLQSKTEYIEEYKNIKTYTKKGYEAGSYIVYVYSEIKFTSVNTPAPSLAKFYLVTDEKGKLKIYSDEMNDELKAYIAERNNDTDVKKLIDATNTKAKKAKAKDEDLKKFWEAIEKVANNSKDNTKAQGDDAE